MTFPSTILYNIKLEKRLRISDDKIYPYVSVNKALRFVDYNNDELKDFILCHYDHAKYELPKVFKRGVLVKQNPLPFVIYRPFFLKLKKQWFISNRMIKLLNKTIYL